MCTLLQQEASNVFKSSLKASNQSLSGLPHLQPSYLSTSIAGLSEWLLNTELQKISPQPVKLTSVNHKVVMEMAPEGNQYPPSSSAPTHLSYRVDRPFLYLIRDETSGALLFIGRVVNPTGLTI